MTIWTGKSALVAVALLLGGGAGSLVALSEEGATSPPAAAPPVAEAAPQSVEATVTVATGDGAPLPALSRSEVLLLGPGSGYQPLATLPAGQRLSITGRDATGAWLAVSLAGLIGWLPVSAVSGVAIPDLSVVAPMALPPPQLQTTSKPAPSVGATRRSPGPTPTPAPRRDTRPAARQDEAPSAGTGASACSILDARGYSNARERTYYMRNCR